MKVDAKIIDTHYDFGLKGTTITFLAYGNITPSLEEYLNLEVNLEVKKNNKRSHSANSYLWTLLGELQRKLRIPKEEIYRKYVRECGVYQIIPIRDDAVDRFVNDVWSKNGIGWVCETMPSKLQGYTNVLAYYGTSTYTKDEMAVLLDQVVQDCVEQNIPTKRKEEIDNLLEEIEKNGN